MDIPSENVFELKEASYKELDDIRNKVYATAKPHTRELTKGTGIYGNEDYQFGFLWDRAKIRAMEKGASNDYIIVSFMMLKTLYIDWLQLRRTTKDSRVCLTWTLRYRDTKNEEYKFLWNILA